MKKSNLLFLLLVLTGLSNVSNAQPPPAWMVNPSDYQYQMTMTCIANDSCLNLADPNNYIAAFVGTQCRGVVKTNTTVGSSKLGLLTIYSNNVSGEVVKFQIYKASINAVRNVLDSTTFAQGQQIGTLINPFVLYANHAPTDIAISNNSISENSSLGTIIAALSATDQDPGTIFSYSLTATQPENTQFAISGNNLTVNSNFNYESDSVKVIEIQVDDMRGCKYVKTFTIKITNVNEAPTVLKLTSPVISDHQQANSLMGKFSTIDQDFNDSHAYSLVAGIGSTDNSQFYIKNDTLFNVSKIDYTAQSIYHIRARSTDLGGLFVEDTFNIVISNVNDAPTNILLNNFSVKENLPAGTRIDTLVAVDVDPGDTHTFALIAGAGSADNAKVVITGNVLKTNASYNFEKQDSLFIRVQVTDFANATFVKTFVIVVLDTNEVPTNIALSNDTITEGLPVNSFVGKFTTTDEDFLATHTYSLVAGTGSTDNALFAINNDSLKTAATYTFNSQTYSIRVRTTDNGSLFYEKVFSVMVRDSNYVPTDIIPSALSFNENIAIGTTVATLATVDYDVPDTHILTLVSGTGSQDNAYFKIVNDSLRTDSLINYEVKKVFNIRVQSTDPGNKSVVKTFTLTANDINEAPIDITLSADSILELLPANSLIGNLTSADPDAGSTHTYSLATGAGDTDNSLFTISGNQLLSAITYVYSGQTYSLRLRSTDNGSLTFEKVFQIRILNANESPTDIIIDSAYVAEDNAPMFYLSRIRSVDIDNPDFYTYTLVAGTGDEDNAEFTITGDELFINSKANFDVKDVYHIRVKSQDIGGLSIEKAFDVTVYDVEGNTIPLPSTNYISPNDDGKNDFWKIDNVEIYKDFTLKIFDQFGFIIYEVPGNYNNEFDGRINGKPLPTGNYYYVFKNDKKIFKGNITIVN